MTDINPAFIDVDLTPPEGEGTGLLEQDRETFASGVRCGSVGDGSLIERSKWKDLAAQAEPILRGSIRWVLNQGREGSCVGASTTGAVMATGRLQFGDSFPLLSLMSLYERIGRSSSSGAYIPDGINEAMERGILPADTIENRGEFELTYPMTGWNPRRLRSLNWEGQAEQFRVSTVKRVEGPDEWFTALYSGWPIVYGRRGHAIFSLLPKWSRGAWYFGYVNSWGQWGDKINDVVGLGMGWDSERTIRDCVGYAITSVVRRERETL